MRATSIVAVVLAVMLMLAATSFWSGYDRFLQSQQGQLVKYSEGILWRCDDSLGEKLCRYLLFPARLVVEELPVALREVQWEIRRSKFPKTELPILRIYLSDGAIGKLQRKRQRTEPTTWLLKSLIQPARSPRLNAGGLRLATEFRLTAPTWRG